MKQQLGKTTQKIVDVRFNSQWVDSWRSGVDVKKAYYIPVISFHES